MKTPGMRGPQSNLLVEEERDPAGQVNQTQLNQGKLKQPSIGHPLADLHQPVQGSGSGLLALAPNPDLKILGTIRRPIYIVIQEEGF